MQTNRLDARPSQISTSWSVLRQAHDGPPDAMAAAQHILLQRYGGAVHRYLLAALHDRHAADDLTQEFGLRLVRGDFHHVDARRGHFRDYIQYRSSAAAQNAASYLDKGNLNPCPIRRLR